MKPMLIFDYDGTLHETMYIYRPAIEKVVRYLNEERGYSVKMPSDRRISSWLGMSTHDMWQDFMPALPAEEKEKAGKVVGGYMQQALLEGKARWYRGVPEMLDELCKKGYILIILSNCSMSYAKAQWSVFKMDRWFSAFFDCESYGGIPKEQILEIILAGFPGEFRRAQVKNDRFVPDGVPEKYLVIGDRDRDAAAAERVGAPFIGCAYGYGTEEELRNADIIVPSPAEIVPAAEMVLKKRHTINC